MLATFALLSFFTLPITHSLADPIDLSHCATPTEDSKPSNSVLLQTAALLAVPTYFLGVTMHEGSHALAAKALGADDVSITILPTRTNKGMFALGKTHIGSFPGETVDKDFVWVLAPKATDLLIMGIYSGILESGNMPKNKWAQLSLSMLGTLALLDFSKHIFATDPNNDMVWIYEKMGAKNESEKLPYRLIHTSLAIGGAIEVGKGWYRLLKGPPQNSPEVSVIRPKKTEVKSFGTPVISANEVGWRIDF